MKKGDFVEDDNGHVEQLTADPKDGVVHTSKIGRSPRCVEGLTVVDPPFVVGETVFRDGEYWRVEKLYTDAGEFRAVLANGWRTLKQYCRHLEPVDLDWQLTRVVKLEEDDQFLSPIVSREISSAVPPDEIDEEVHMASRLLKVRAIDSRHPHNIYTCQGKRYIDNDYVWRRQ